MHRLLSAETQRLRCTPLAVGGMPDHVHLLVQVASTVSVARLLQQVKGVSSFVVNQQRPEFSEPFGWQDGYACFSVTPDPESLRTLVRYIRNQRVHHQQGCLVEVWEEVGPAV